MAKACSSGKLQSLQVSRDGEAGVEKKAGELHDEVGEWGMSEQKEFWKQKQDL